VSDRPFRPGDDAVKHTVLLQVVIGVNLVHRGAVVPDEQVAWAREVDGGVKALDERGAAQAIALETPDEAVRGGIIHTVGVMGTQYLIDVFLQEDAVHKTQTCQFCVVSPEYPASSVLTMLDVIHNYDEKPVFRVKRSGPTLTFEKRVNGSIIVVQQIRGNSGTFSFFDMWIKKN